MPQRVRIEQRRGMQHCDLRSQSLRWRSRDQIQTTVENARRKYQPEARM